jgi:hypothetical protein
MRKTLCIEDQNGDRVVYHRRTHVPFGLQFAKYMRSKGIPPIGGLFLSNGRRIGLRETNTGMGLNTGYHVIIFVNLLMFIDHHDLEYQDFYPLTGENEREGVLDKGTMANVIDASIQKGHVVDESVPKGDEVLPPLHKHYCMLEGDESQFYHWSLYMAHQSLDIEFGDHSKTEFLFEIKTIHRSGKASKKWLIKNQEWGGKMLFTYQLNYGLIRVIEISSTNLLKYRHGGEFSLFIGARIIAGIMQFIPNGVMI